MEFSEIKSKIDSFHNEGLTKEAANWLVEEYQMQDDFLEGFEFRERADPSMVLFTTEGDFGKQQIIRIPENAFQFSLPLMLSLLAHEMVHVRQKTREPFVLDKNEREWQAYYEMLFRKIFPSIPEISAFHKKAFANKAIEYYNRMGENSDLQKKYSEQKTEVDALITALS